MIHNDDYRLQLIYDLLNRWGADDDFFAALAGETPRARILDLGCGTGRLALALAEAGHSVTGVDPDAAALEAAKRKPGAEQVTWLLGTSAILTDATYDLALMTSHVAQFIADDLDWVDTLDNVRRSLVPGGRLAFDSRDPMSRAWESWTPDATRAVVQLPDGTRAEVWNEVTRRAGELITVREYTRMLETGEQHVADAVLSFRTEADLRSSLDANGFEMEQVYGWWKREPAEYGDGQLIFLARRA